MFLGGFILGFKGVRVFGRGICLRVLFGVGCWGMEGVDGWGWEFLAVFFERNLSLILSLKFKYGYFRMIL